MYGHNIKWEMAGKRVNRDGQTPIILYTIKERQKEGAASFGGK